VTVFPIKKGAIGINPNSAFAIIVFNIPVLFPNVNASRAVQF
jgi:hypothetical protein